jgi:hypothetical protein
MAAIAVVVVLAAAGAAMYFISPGPAALQVQAPAPAPGEPEQLPPAAPVMAPVSAPVPAPALGGVVGGVVGGGPAASSSLGVGAYVGIGVGVLALVAGIAYLAKGKRAEGFRKSAGQKLGTFRTSAGQKLRATKDYIKTSPTRITQSVRGVIRGKKSTGRMDKIRISEISKTSQFQEYPFVLLFFMQYNNKEIENMFKNCSGKNMDTFNVNFQMLTLAKIKALVQRFKEVDADPKFSTSWVKRKFKTQPPTDNLERAILKFNAFIDELRISSSQGVQMILGMLGCPGNEFYKRGLNDSFLPNANQLDSIHKQIINDLKEEASRKEQEKQNLIQQGRTAEAIEKDKEIKAIQEELKTTQEGKDEIKKLLFQEQYELKNVRKDLQGAQEKLKELETNTELQLSKLRKALATSNNQNNIKNLVINSLRARAAELESKTHNDALVIALRSSQAESGIRQRRINELEFAENQLIKTRAELAKAKELLNDAVMIPSNSPKEKQNWINKSISYLESFGLFGG